MAVRTMTLKRWRQLNEELPTERGKPSPVNSWSPGGAADQLGISRQAVHKAIRAGHLDAIRVVDGTKVIMFMVIDASLKAYRRRLLAQASERVNRLTRAS